MLSIATDEPGITQAAFGIAIGAATLLGLLCRFFCSVDEHSGFNTFDAFASVSLGWIVVVILGALPYLISGVLPHPADAWFESMSGFTTTGASVIEPDRLESVPSSVLFWRSLTQWLGGLGIVVLFVALFPSFGAGGSVLFQAEAPGPPSQRTRPRIAESARVVWKIYVVLTVLLAAILALSGLSLFDAICHAFTTLSTGGFSTRAASVGAFSPLVQWEITVFMIIAGVNFALMFMLMRGQFRDVWRDTELRTYVGLFVVAAAVIALVLIKSYDLPGSTPDSSTQDKIRHATFTVASIITTTGFATDDFDRWPDFCRVFLVALMIMGACAGSTSGGMKLIRGVILGKYLRNEMRRIEHPTAVMTVKVGGRPVPQTVVAGIIGFFILYTITWLAGVLFLELLGVESSTTLGASLSCLSNIGPGLDAVGPSRDYHNLPVLARAGLPWMMLLGRLEFYAFLMLFTPSMWRSLRSREGGQR